MGENVMSKKRTSDSRRPSVHVSIDVPNLEEGLRFYRKVFGFIETARPFPTMAVLDANNVTVCMHEKTSGTKSSPSSPATRDYNRHWTPVHLDLHVEDFDAVLAKVRSEGGTVEMEFKNRGPMPAGFCSDPFGNGLCVIGEGAQKS
jgi:predicted enzyme related to lactoylglutathione lyase